MPVTDFLHPRPFETLKKDLANKKDAVARERAAVAIGAIASHSEISAHVEPFLADILGPVLNAVGDKVAAVKDAATSAALAIAQYIVGYWNDNQKHGSSLRGVEEA